MNGLRLVLASLFHHRRNNVAVALGVAAATAVLTGALLVGSSVRESLRGLTLERLGKIDEVLVAPRFFREELASELAATDGFDEQYAGAIPAILLRGSIERRDPNDFENTSRAGRVSVIGCDERFWDLGEGRPERIPDLGEIVLNRPLADELGAKVGDAVSLRIPQIANIPADSPLGKKTGTVRSLAQLNVIAIIEAEGLGRFGLHPNQQLPRNAYLSTETLQQSLKLPGQVNAIFIAGLRSDAAAAEAASKKLQAWLRPKFADYGLSLSSVTIGEGDRVVSRYFSLSSDQMLLPPGIEEAAVRSQADKKVQPVLTYLANTIAGGNGRADGIPYSTITAIDSDAGIGPLVDADGQPISGLADDEIVLNRWAADQLKVSLGDEIAVTYFEPESTHGETRETIAKFRLKAIVQLAKPGEPPTLANDPGLTPQVKGFTDKKSIDAWDPPFPYDKSRIKDADDEYWTDYSTTPKAFVSLSAGRKLWSSRFGETTSLRMAATGGLSAEDIQQKIEQHLDPAAAGFLFQPVKRRGLDAASGTTPFDVLFLMFSFFIIGAALMLVLLLFRLGIDQRASEIGILLATGFRRQRAGRLLAAEGLLVSGLGGLLGVAIGVGYAWLLIAALTSEHFWQAAISTPFLKLHVDPVAMVIGYVCGVAVSLITIAWALRRLSKLPVRGLLAGVTEPPAARANTRAPLALLAAAICLVVAVSLGLFASQLGSEARIGAFFGSGALVLIASLTFIWWWLRSSGSRESSARRFSLARLAARNGARSPGRSTLTIGLVASASFLIVAISAFRLDPTSQGAGGYALWAESDLPIYVDLSDGDALFEFGFDDADVELLSRATTVSLRVRDGEDASCLNLNQATQPRVLGLSPEMIERGGFLWAGSAASNEETVANPWLLLEAKQDAEESGRVPVVLDMNTAMYSLQLYGGVGSIFEIKDGLGRPQQLKVVGLLKNSIFQGDVLMSEAHFKQLFPRETGHRLFLIAPGEGDDAAGVRKALESKLGNYGMAAELTSHRLEGFMAVQNTYLSTFQSLGGLGLLLGTFGLATVQLRNVFERRRELALMRAVGFRRGQLAGMVLMENAVLLLGGLGAGCLAAIVAILPHLLTDSANIPLPTLAIILAIVLIVGMAAGLAAVRATLRAPILSALRGE
jgi:ABC-type antimicrobial peptide transport system permease subunit